MRIALAAIGQETDSFTPLRTTLDTFREFGLYEGEEFLETQRDVGYIGGFFAEARRQGIDVEPVPTLRAWAGANGIITDDTIEYFIDRLEASLSNALPIDGFFFMLHGAAAAESEDDVEGYLLEKVRGVIGRDVPLVVPMDHHASITQRIVDNCDALVATRTQPHDPFETGELGARLLFALMRGEIHPTMAYQRIPMVTHQEQFLTSRGPMKEWFDKAREIEGRPGVLSVSPCPMQPWLDVAEGGYTVTVVTENDLPLARKLAAELADHAWSLRHDLWKMEGIAPAEAVRRAIAAEKGLVVLSDTGDTVWGGATGDGTSILKELLRQPAPGIALVPIVDAEVVDIATRAGVGSEITVKVGGKVDQVWSEPVEITGTVAGTASGRVHAETVGLDSFDMGRSVLLEVGNIRLMVSELRGIGGNHPVVYQLFGIDPADAKMVVVKTSSNWQYFNPWLSQVIRVDTPGPTMSHLERFTWTRIRRPIWPLDDLEEWQAQGGHI